VGPSEQSDTDVDYLFGHVSIREPHIDYSGNCGNLTAAVAAFAVDQGLAPVPEGARQVRVRIHQRNLGKRIEALVPVGADGRAAVDGDYPVDGVSHTGARIDVDFLDPAGEAGVLPTGSSVDELEIPGVGRVEATLVDAGNVTVFCRARDFGCTATETPAELNARPELLDRLEHVRAAATVHLGLADSAEEASRDRPATPKIALVGPPSGYTTTSGEQLGAGDMALCARILSMGRAHHAFTGTGAVSLAAAAALPGTLVAEALGGERNDQSFRLGHAAGRMDLAGRVHQRGAQWYAERVTLGRSARALMRGEVLVPALAKA
jgi:2-methylaconitate cis-trans-isomerase PrpF